MDITQVYDLDDLKKLQENGASAAEVREAYAMMEANKERRAKATEKLLTLDWKKVSLEEVKDLLSQGADVKGKDWWSGETSLHYASANGHVEVVKLLLAYGADVKTKNIRGMTPLHVVSEYGYIKVAKILLAHGADIKGKDKNGNTPADLARKEGHTDVATFLKEMEELSAKRTTKAKEIRSVDADRSGQPVDHSLRRVLFGGDRLRQNAPLSLIVVERLKERQSRS